MDFDSLFRRLYPQLFRYLHRLTGSADAADDLAQESFSRLLGRSMPDDDARRWLFTVATNLARDAARQTSNRRRLLSLVAAERPDRVVPDDTVVRRESVEAVRAALDGIPARDRAMLLMREEGLRYQEIAQAVGVAPGSVGTLIARAAKKFAAAYLEQGRGDESSG
ncbi:MAG TPA: sigma-70 family RNA polymerase sigma factor [Longimicrobiaceae bacterium]|nr:sigma-70 family RNA polymerase sigma factor [Longimicrobiaceae bacterium]